MAPAWLPAWLLAVLLAVLLAGPVPHAARVEAAPAAAPLRMATTTSTQNSGLLDDLLPRFERRFGLRVHVIAVGTGKALRMGASGDVDLVLVHAPKAELAYVKKGAYVGRRELMHNFFVLLGPPRDPAQAGAAQNVGAALARIAAGGFPFVSRGDGSGTHIKEQALWKGAGSPARGDWYLEVGQGMGKTLIIANEKLAYTLSDAGTFYAFKGRLELKILSGAEASLRNPYSAMAVNPARFPHVNHAGAMQLIEWLASPEAQKAIGAFTANGQQLFVPRSPAR